jgi:hypothetical protein
MRNAVAIGARISLGAATLIAVVGLAEPVTAQPGDNLPIYTSPVDVTGGRLILEAVVPDRDTGALNPQPLPPGVLTPGLAALTGAPINMVLDSAWNGTAANSPRQLACDGPEGVQDQVRGQVAAQGEEVLTISCSLVTSGQVFVRQVESGFFLSYQLFGNSASFRTTCRAVDNLCPSKPRFTVHFALEMLTLIRTPSVCSIVADRPTVHLHAVNIESENVPAGAAQLYDQLFEGNQFLAGELAIQRVLAAAPLPVDAAFAELRASPACTAGTPANQALAGFSRLETEIKLPDGIFIRAIHPAIEAPRFQNVSLHHGDDTCKDGFVWRDAFEGDHVCVTPETRAQVAADNAQAAARRSPTGGPYGPNTCLEGYVWRDARPGDVVCVTPEARALAAADNAASLSRRVLAPAEYPSLARPSVSTPPVVVAGAQFGVIGQYFGKSNDPTKLGLWMERDTNSACFGGASELEHSRFGDQPEIMRLSPTPGAMSSCSYRHEVSGLQPSTQYRFRIRDCDAVTCSAWSAPFEILTGSGTGASPVALTLDAGIALGSVAADADGAFVTSVTMPADTAPGRHILQAASGQLADTTTIQVTGAGAEAKLMVTDAYSGDVGCPMRETRNAIPAARQFTLFGSDFGAGLVAIYLNSINGPLLGSAQPDGDGTFCAYFNGPSQDSTGDHMLVAIQDGASRATLPVKVETVSSGPN